MNNAKGVFLHRGAMLAHAIRLQAWSVTPVHSLGEFSLAQLEAWLNVEVAAADLANALEQASACHEGAPNSMAGAILALQAGEDQPLSPAARWLSARLPARCSPFLWQAAQL